MRLGYLAYSDAEPMKDQKVNLALKVFFLLSSLEGLGTLIYLLAIPGDPKHAWLGGYSAQRVSMILGMLILEVLLVWITVGLRQDAAWTQPARRRVNALLARVGLRRGLAAVLFASSLAGMFFFYQGVWTAEDVVASAYYSRLAPFSLLGAVICAQMLAMFLLSESGIASPFLSGGRMVKPLVAVFLFINGAVFFNALTHDPTIGYDGLGHLDYVVTLAENRLPAFEDTHEYFSPPLPYVFPSLSLKLCETTSPKSWVFISGVDYCTFIAGKFYQLQNFLFSIGLTYFFIKLCGLLRPQNAAFKVTALALLGMLPVYYKSFAFARGEPLVAFLTVLSIYQVMVMLFEPEKNRVADAILLGVLLGLLILSRQWGMAMFPAILLSALMLHLKYKREAFPFVRTAVVSFLVAFVVGGWFYLSMQVRFGSVTSLPRDPTDTLSSQPAEFYFDLGLEDLFTNPTRLVFGNRLLPIFYSEIWGDYWNYFVVTGYDPVSHEWSSSNREAMGPYLGRVNLVSLFPTLVLLAGVAVGGMQAWKGFVNRSDEDWQTYSRYGLLFFVILVSLAGYLVFLIQYPNYKGDTVKATYMLQVFAVLPLLAAQFLESVKQRRKSLYTLAVILLAAVFLHNLPVMITRYGYF